MRSFNSKRKLANLKIRLKNLKLALLGRLFNSRPVKWYFKRYFGLPEDVEIFKIGRTSVHYWKDKSSNLAICRDWGRDVLILPNWLVKIFHFWDTKIANKICPFLNLGYDRSAVCNAATYIQKHAPDYCEGQRLDAFLVGNMIADPFRTYRGLMDWTLPQGSGEIMSVKLYTWCPYAASDEPWWQPLRTPFKVALFELTQPEPFNVNEVTWNQWKANHPWNTPGGDFSPNKIVDETTFTQKWGSWHEFTLGQGAFNPIQNLTWGTRFDFIFKVDSETTINRYVWLSGPLYWVPEYRAFIEILYYPEGYVPVAPIVEPEDTSRKLSPIKDAFIWNYYPNSKYGKELFLGVGRTTSSPAGTRKTIIQFRTSAKPYNKGKILSAKLFLYKQSNDKSGHTNPEVEVRQLVGQTDWDEATVTWNSPWQSPGAVLETAGNVIARTREPLGWGQAGWEDWTIYGREALSNYPDFDWDKEINLILQFPHSPENSRTFWNSREGANKPYLEILFEFEEGINTGAVNLKDALIYRLRPNDNFGNLLFLWVNWKEDDPNEEARSLLNFSIPTISKHATILDMRLWLHKILDSSDALCPAMELWSTDGNWEEGTVTWNSINGGALHRLISLTNNPRPRGERGWESWTLTPFDEFIGRNVTFLLKSPGGASNSTGWASREFAIPGFMPYIEIIYRFDTKSINEVDTFVDSKGGTYNDYTFLEAAYSRATRRIARILMRWKIGRGRGQIRGAKLHLFCKERSGPARYLSLYPASGEVKEDTSWGSNIVPIAPKVCDVFVEEKNKWYSFPLLGPGASTAFPNFDWGERINLVIKDSETWTYPGYVEDFEDVSTLEEAGWQKELGPEICTGGSWGPFQAPGSQASIDEGAGYGGSKGLRMSAQYDGFARVWKNIQPLSNCIIYFYLSAWADWQSSVICRMFLNNGNTNVITIQISFSIGWFGWAWQGPIYEYLGGSYWINGWFPTFFALQLDNTNQRFRMRALNQYGNWTDWTAWSEFSGQAINRIHLETTGGAPYPPCSRGHGFFDAFGFVPVSEEPLKSSQFNSKEYLREVPYIEIDYLPEYDARIEAFCEITNSPLTLRITRNGVDTGLDTPRTFYSLVGQQRFALPTTDAHGHRFLRWEGKDSYMPTIVEKGGVYKAIYGELAPQEPEPRPPEQPMRPFITVEPSSVVLSKGESSQLRCYYYDENRYRTEITESAFWTSTNSSVVSVSNASGTRGQIAALEYGTARVFASYGNYTANCFCSVPEPPAPPANVERKTFAVKSDLVKTTDQFAVFAAFHEEEEPGYPDFISTKRFAVLTNFESTGVKNLAVTSELEVIRRIPVNAILEKPIVRGFGVTTKLGEEDTGTIPVVSNLEFGMGTKFAVFCDLERYETEIRSIAVGSTLLYAFDMETRDVAKFGGFEVSEFPSDPDM